LRSPRAFELIETFEGIESGKGSDALDKRPQLAAALKAKAGAALACGRNAGVPAVQAARNAL
jgi:hypothetical protein